MDDEYQQQLVRQNIVAGYGSEALFQKPLQTSWSREKIKVNELPSYLKHDPVLFRFFSRLHYEDKNFLCIVVGETGVGKSCTAISLARALDITPLGQGKFKRNFVVADDGHGNASPDCRVVFGASQFIKLVKRGLPKGSVIIWDEAGVGNDATQWFDKKSQIIKHIMQTFRSRNYGIFMTVPDRESVALQTRRLVHCYIDVFDRTESYARTRVAWVQRKRGNEKTKVYYKAPITRDAVTGQLKKVTEYRIPKLDPKIERIYNKIKDNTLQNLYEFYQREMDFMDQELGLKLTQAEQLIDQKLKKFNLPFGMDLCSKNVDEIIDKDTGEYSKAKIMLLLNKRGIDCSLQNAKTIIEILPPASIKESEGLDVI